MPVYEYQGQFYELSETDPVAAKKKIIASVGGPAPEGGFFPALRAGATELGGGISALMGRVGLKDVAQAQQEYEAAKQKAAEIFQPTEEGWTESPWTKFKETLGGSLPYMAAPLAAGAAAATLPVTGPAAVATTLGAAGLASHGQFTATNLARQLEEEKKRTGAYDLAGTDIQSAALAAIPQAALDTLALRFMPGVGKLLGDAGIQVTKESAKQVSEQILKKAVTDYALTTGKAVGREGLTESAQQVFERLQAGLSITDPDARREYVESFIGGAVLGGALAPAGRYMERGTAARQVAGIEQEEALQQRQAARAAEEAKRKDPAYALQLDADYQAAVQKMQELQAAVPKRPGKDALPEEQMAFQEAKAARDTHLKEVLQPLADEYVPRKAEIAQLKERQRVEGMTQEEYMLEQMGVPPSAAPATQEDYLLQQLNAPPPAAPPAEASVLDQYAEQQIQLANEREFADALTPEEQQTAYAKYLSADPTYLQSLVQSRAALPGLSGKLSAKVRDQLKLVLKARNAEQAAAAAKAQQEREAQAEKEAAQTLRQQQARAAYEQTLAGQQEVAGLQERMGDAVEKAQQQRAVAQAFEAFAPTETLPAPSRALTDVTQQLQLAPETLRLDRINQVIRNVQTLIDNRRETKADTAVPEQRLARLEKLKADAEKNYQRKLFDLAEQQQAMPREAPLKPVGPKQRVQGEFNLYGEAIPAERPVTYEDLRERLTRAQASRGLSDDAYDFLKRVESVLPTQDVQGLYPLIDRQLRLIESGQEGVARKGAEKPSMLKAFPVEGRAAVEAPTKATSDDLRRQALFQMKLQQGASRKDAAAAAFRASDKDLAAVAELPVAERAEVTVGAPVQKLTRRVEEQPPLEIGERPLEGRTLRGPSAEALGLSMQEELEPLVSRLERGRAETQAGQQTLFPEEQEKLVTERKTPAQFQRFLKSGAAEKLRDIAAPSRVIERAKEELGKIQETIAYLQNIIDEIDAARANAYPFEKLNAARKELKLLQIRSKNVREPQEKIPATVERIQALEKLIDTAEQQKAKLKNSYALLKKQRRVTFDGYERLLRESGGVLGKVTTQMQLNGRLAELTRQRNERMAVIQQAAISPEEKAQLAEKVNAISAEQADVQEQLKKLNDNLAYIDANIRVEDAAQRLSDYADRAEPDEQMLAAASKDLSAAKRAANKLTRAISSKETALIKETAALRRQREAIDYEERRTASNERFKAEQARMERAQTAPEGVDTLGQPLKATVYPAITAAQRLAKEDATPSILVEELRQIKGNPVKVLTGYRSRITDITKRLQASLDRARQYTVDGVKEKKPYEAALQAYTKAIASESPEFRAIEDRRQTELARINAREMSPEMRQTIYAQINRDAEKAHAALPSKRNPARAALEPQLRKLETAYMDAVTNALAARVMPKGVVKFQTELAGLLRKEAWLNDRISKGTVETATVPEPKTRLSVAEKEAQEAERLAQYTQEAVDRAGAPEIDVTAKTRSDIEKARKTQKTQYSSKGVGLETEIDEDIIREKAEKRVLLRTPMTPQEREAQAIKTIVDQAKDKLAKKQELTPVEQMVLEEYNRSRKPSKGKKAVEEVEEEAVELSSEELQEREVEEERAAFEQEEEEETGTRRGGFGEIESLFDQPDVELSRGTTENPSTIDSVRTELKKNFPDLGRVQIYDSVDALIKANPQYEGKIPSDARGFVDTAGNKAFLIAENIEQGQALSVLLHEVGTHIGLKNMLGDAQYNALVNAVKSWEKKADGSIEARVAKAARSRVEAAETKPSQVNDELLAYAVEEAVNAGVKPAETKGVLGQWLSQIASLFRRALERFGLPPKAMDTQGLVDLAFGAAQMEMRPAVPQMSRRQFLRGAGAALGAMKLPPLSKEMNLRALRSVFEGSLDARAAWFDALKTAAKTNGLEKVIGQYEDLYEGDNPLVAFTQSDALQSFLYNTTYNENYQGDGYDYYLNELLSGKDGIKIVADLQQALRAQASGLVEAAQKLAKEKALPEVGELFFSKNLPTAARVANQIIGKQPTMLDSVKKNMGLAFRTQVIDALAPLEKIANTSMDALKGTQMMYYLRMYGMRNNMVAEAISNGVVQLKQLDRVDGEKEWVIESEKGVNIKDMVKRLAQKDVAKAAGSPDAANRLFTLYMAALRGERVGYNKLSFGRAAAEAELREVERELAAPGLTPEDKPRLLQRKAYLEQNINSLPTEADFKDAKAEIEANDTLKSAFEEVREMYNEYNSNLLKFLVDTGAMSKDVAERLLKDKDYIPYYRMRGGNAELVIGGETPIRVGNIKDSPHLQELVGGEEPIFNFLDSSVQNTSMLLDMALRNIAAKNVAYELADVGLASKPVKVGKSGAPRGSLEFKKDGVDHYVVVNTDHTGVPSDLLVKGMAGIPTMLPVGIRLLGIPARVLRRAVTSTPIFAAKQLFRDSTAAFILSGTNSVPLLGALRKLGKTSPLEARGITGGQTFTGMPEDVSRLLREMQEGRPGWSKAFAKMEALSIEADAATRRAQYESYRAQGLSEMEATLMALESMNFSKRGLSPTMHMASTLVPFLNSQIQGLDVLYKALTGKMPFNEKLDIQRKLFTRGAMMFMGTMAYAAAMQDDEEYKNAPPDVKYGNWFVRVPFLDQYADEPVTVRVPIPFEVGYIFKALPEMLYNSMQSEAGAKDALKALNHILIQMVPGGSSMVPIQIGDVKVPAPVIIPAAMKPIIEVGLGKSFFTGRDIESAREQQEVPGMRYRTGTSEIAKYIGEATNFSPIKIETLVSGYTGGLGLALLQALSLPLPKAATEVPEKRWSELPLVGSIFQPADASGIVNDVYERLQKVTQASATYKGLMDRGEVGKAQEFLQKNLPLIALESLAGDYRKDMGELARDEREIRGAPTLTKEEKTKLLAQIRQTKIQIATQVRTLLAKTTEASERKAPQAAPA